MFNKKEKKCDECLDVNTLTDLVSAVMNEAELEEHLMFTFLKSNKDIYLRLLKEVRGNRTDSLGVIIGELPFDLACMCKHLLIICDRYLEVGEKLVSQDKLDMAKKMLNKARYYYELFFTVVLKRELFK